MGRAVYYFSRAAHRSTLRVKGHCTVCRHTWGRGIAHLWPVDHYLEFNRSCVCPRCGGKGAMLDPLAKVPRKKAGRAAWNRFYRIFKYYPAQNLFACAATAKQIGI